MSKKINRRGFLKNSVLASAGAIVGLGFEERGLLAAQRRGSAPEKPKGVMPKGKIGKVEMSRLIIGGNVLGGGAHARDLMYVSRLMRAYNTTEKVMECLQLAEENGIDMNFDGGRRITNYNKERGGKMRWMAQVHPKADDLTSASQRAIDQGAIGAYLWGAQADRWVQTNRLDLIDGFVSFLKKNGLLAGVGGHVYNVPQACEKAGIEADFYFKTLHPGNYWSATPRDERFDYMADSHCWGGNDDHDNIWSANPEKTTEVMSRIKKPWVAYKVLAAGAVHPRDGFKFAFENGADFICAGMLDFQVTEDANIVKEIFAEITKKGRERSWRG